MILNFTYSRNACVSAYSRSLLTPSLSKIIALLLFVLMQNSFAAELFSSRTPPTNPSDWRRIDRLAYIKARQSVMLVPTFGDQKPGSEFFAAWSNNIHSNQPGEYKTIAQRHAFYDMFASIIFGPALTDFPDKLRCIKFFDVAARVTDDYHIGSQEIESFEHLLARGTGNLPTLTDIQKDFLLQTNETLFKANFKAIRSLMLDWKRPQRPDGTSSDELSPLAFDLQMVELEQSLVQAQIDAFRIKFGESALKEVTAQFRPHTAASTLFLVMLRGISAVGADRSNTLLKEWMPKLGVEQLDFDSLSHRIKFGQANIFHEHGLTVNDQIAYEKTKTIPASTCKYIKHFATDPDLVPEHIRARTLAAVSGLAADRTGVAPAIVEAYAIKVREFLPGDPKLLQAKATAQRMLNALPRIRDSSELLDLVYSDDATSIGLGNFASSLHILPSHYSGRVSEKTNDSQNQLNRLAVLLSQSNSSSEVWPLVESLTGVGLNTSVSALTNGANNGAARSVSEAITALSHSGTAPEQVSQLIKSAAAEAIKDSISSVQRTSKLIGQARDSWIYLDELQSGNVRGGIQAISALAKIFGNDELSNIANQASSAVQIITAIQDISEGGMLSGGMGAMTMMSTGGAAALPGLLAGASDGEAAATRQALGEIKELLKHQFAIVNAKLDRVLEILADNTKTLSDIRLELHSIGVAIFRIDERIGQLSLQLAQIGQDLGTLVKEGDVAGCRGQISSNSFTSYYDCVGQIVEYINSAYSPVIARCPPSGVDARSSLVESYPVLAAGDIWEFGSLTCYINRSIEVAQGLPFIDTRLPNFALLASGTGMLRSLRLQQPELWKNIGDESHQRIRSVRERIESLGDLQRARLGLTLDSPKTYFESAFAANFPGLQSLASTLDSISKEKKLAATNDFIKKSLNWFSTQLVDTAHADQGGTDDDNVMMFNVRHNGYMVGPCNALVPGRLLEWIQGGWGMTNSSQKNARKAPIALLRALEDPAWMQMNSGLPNYPWRESRLCHNYQDVHWDYAGNNKRLVFKIYFQLALGGTINTYTTDWIYTETWMPRELDDDSSTRRFLLREISEGYPDKLQEALDSWAKPIKSAIEASFEDKLTRDRTFFEFFLKFQRIAWSKALTPIRDSLDAKWDDLAISRAILRSYLISLFPNIWQSSDLIQSLLGATGGIAMPQKGAFKLTVLQGDKVTVCGKEVDPIRELPSTSTFTVAFDECQRQWKGAVAALSFRDDEQWKSYAELFDAALSLKALDAP